MNYDCTYVDGKVVVTDYQNIKTFREYSDNLGEILAQENLIETIENRISELESRRSKPNEEPFRPIIFPGVGIILLAGTPLLFAFFEGSEPFITTVDTLFGTMPIVSSYILCLSIGILPFAAIGDFCMYKKYQTSQNEEREVESELYILNRQLEKAKSHLEKLQREKTYEQKTTEFRTVLVDDREKLEELKALLNLFRDLGYNGKKYYRLYEQGMLTAKLQKQYDKETVQEAQKYIEEKGPSLVMKKRQEKPNRWFI